MPLPEPRRVKVEEEKLAPTTPTAPTSWFVQGAGSWPGVIVQVKLALPVAAVGSTAVTVTE